MLSAAEASAIDDVDDDNGLLVSHTPTSDVPADKN